MADDILNIGDNENIDFNIAFKVETQQLAELEKRLFAIQKSVDNAQNKKYKIQMQTNIDEVHASILAIKKGMEQVAQYKVNTTNLKEFKIVQDAIAESTENAAKSVNNLSLSCMAYEDIIKNKSVIKVNEELNNSLNNIENSGAGVNKTFDNMSNAAKTFEKSIAKPINIKSDDTSLQ
ncbi:MAG: hypothetical protein PHP92_05565 [Candidatus Nanoarchaeia archaeon]|nr:hypothetical protein [Candidatus Nanoarchaeia archaeon]